MPTTVRSYSKINLGLAIGPLRPDGFHGLATLYQTLAAYDTVTVTARSAASTAITLTSSHAQVPVDDRNTAWRMAERVLEEIQMHAEVRIHIEKKLPVQGGIGAGSANAAAALLGLEVELGRRIPAAVRLRLAASIGSDVPLFLLGGAVLGLGRGEQVYPLPDLPPTACVLALPAIGVSTPQAYRDWDTSGPLPLTGPEPFDTIDKLSRSIAVSFGEPHSSGIFSSGEGLAENPLLALVRTGIENDFEKVVFPQHPFLGEIKRILVGSPGTDEAAIFASLSGSGSALFGLYRSTSAAQAALSRLHRHGVPGMLTGTLARSEYWRQMVV